MKEVGPVQVNWLLLEIRLATCSRCNSKLYKWKIGEKLHSIHRSSLEERSGCGGKHRTTFSSSKNTQKLQNYMCGTLIPNVTVGTALQSRRWPCYASMTISMTSPPASAVRTVVRNRANKLEGHLRYLEVDVAVTTEHPPAMTIAIR